VSAQHCPNIFQSKNGKRQNWKEFHQEEAPAGVFAKEYDGADSRG
jgi:hypothetical protein